MSTAAQAGNVRRRVHLQLMDGVSENERLEAWAADKRASAQPIELDAVVPAQRDLLAVLRGPGVTVIAEPGLRSLDEGRLRDDLDPLAFLRACERSGVAALALPTDERRWGLSPGVVKLARTSAIPVIHHDLLIRPRELLAARAWGADAQWIHVGFLDDTSLAEAVALARELQMPLLAEARSVEELARAVNAGCEALCVSAFDEAGALSSDAALELLRTVPRERLRVIRGPVSGATGLEAIRGEVDAMWICGPASMPRDTSGYLGPLVEAASRL